MPSPIISIRGEEGEGRDGGVEMGGDVLRGKSGKGRSSRLNTRRRGWSEEGKAYRPSSEMTRRSKDKKGGEGQGGGQGRGGRRAGQGGGGGSQSLSGSRSSLGRGETNSSMGGNLL